MVFYGTMAIPISFVEIHLPIKIPQRLGCCSPLEDKKGILDFVSEQALCLPQ